MSDDDTGHDTAHRGPPRPSARISHAPPPGRAARLSMPAPGAPPVEHTRYRRRRVLSTALAVATVLGVTAMLFSPLVVGMVSGEEGAATRFFEWDVPEQYWPDLVYLCESMHDGEVPYWNPYDRGGYPYYADPQAGTYHPLGWAICAIAGPHPALGWASARVVASFALCGLFALLWLRRIGASWSGSIAGAAVLMCAPFMRHNWELNLTSGLAYLPLMLWAADRVALERKVQDGVLLALATALAGWVGSPPALFLASGLTGLYLVYRIGERARGRKALRETLAPIAVAVLLVVGLLGVVLVPGLTLAEHSVQAGRSFASIREGALEGDALLAFVWPREGNHLYVGWLALGLIPLALRRRENRLAPFFVAVFVVAGLMTTGGLLFRFAFDHFPGVALFRLPHRYEAWLGPAAAGVAALGLTSTTRTVGGTLALRLRIAAAVAACLGVALLALLDPLTPGLFALAFAIVAFGYTLPPPFDSGSAVWGVLLALIVVLDVTQAMPPDRHMRDGPPPARSEVTASLLSQTRGTRHEHRVMDEFAVTCRVGARTRHRDLRGYQDPLLLASYERVVDSLREHPVLAPQFNVRYALQGPHFIHGWNRHYLPPPLELRRALRTRVRYEDDLERSVTELLDALPFAYFVPAGEVERAVDRDAALARTKALAPSAIAILDDEGAPPGPTLEAEGVARGAAPPLAESRGVVLSPDSVHFVIQAPGEGVVVVNEAFYPGWVARVDGSLVPIRRANGFVRAIPISRGRHTVEMSFDPDDGRRWREVYVLSLFALLVGLVALPLFGRYSRRAKLRG